MYCHVITSCKRNNLTYTATLCTLYIVPKGHAVTQWLRQCATHWKVAGSIPDGVRSFHRHNPSGRTMALGSTQPLTVPGIIPGGKGSRCVELTTLPSSCADVSWNLLETSGLVKACNWIESIVLSSFNACTLEGNFPLCLDRVCSVP
jgi:hypothetical protein